MSRFRAISRVGLVIILVALIVVAAFAVTLVYIIPGTPNKTTSYSSTSSTASIRSSSQTGLQLVISFNSTLIGTGDSVNLSVSARNILSTPNNKSSESDWALPALGQGFGPCTPLNNSPFRIAAFLGHYTMQNISQAKPLTVANPIGAYSCAEISQFVYLVFQPNSSNVEIYGCLGSSCLTQGPFQMNRSYFESYFQDAGYYTNSSSEIGTTTQSYSYHILGVGDYTVAVGDEWGDLTLLYFTVTN